ncbi:hypothetical protein DMC61_31875 [Amycolatopsis sp. WAC 04169]|uniref:hypothetical protein n=1 Tax=Amycolatopsis sp. WAC 04169 TaxID=2203197 RepID=UPI000F77B87C|nr:hypothetical protein [Amycolatopsis sp. WAC 04169]RSN23304.1 hypothetical protein DMC61_31875 [Amycolatopsis sp. WAC 04169]
MVSQIVTLAGVLIGALTSYFATTMTERGKHRRALATRWDERKLAAYIEFATTVKEAADAARTAREAPEKSDLRREALAEMEQVERRRSTAFEALVLLAAPSAIEAAKAVNQVVWEIEIAARAGKTDPTPSNFVPLLNAYHEESRRDLGVPGGSLQVEGAPPKAT